MIFVASSLACSSAIALRFFLSGQGLVSSLCFLVVV